MKLLGIDYGLKRIGLATTDLGRSIASPLVTIQNRGDKKNVATISDICRQHNIGGIVCGVPLDIVGGENDMSRIVRQFGVKLGESLSIEIVFVNERYSSKEAEEHIRENLGITNREKVAELVDKMAAAMILSDYINGDGNEIH